MITIPNLSFKTKKYLLCIFLIVQLLVFMWRQRVYFRFVMSIVPSPFVSLILISSQFLILVSKHMYAWQKRQGWWSVVWDGKNWWFCDMLICSFVHFYFYVNIYSLLSSLHWCLKYQKKILPLWVIRATRKPLLLVFRATRKLILWYLEQSVNSCYRI